MAKQGNYVTLPGGGVNWTKDISDSLAGLSKNLLDQGNKKLDREREDALLATENERYATQQARLGVEQDRVDKEYQRTLDKRNFMKNLPDNEQAIRAQKSLDFDGVSYEAIAKHQGALRDLIPLWREDAVNNAATLYRKQTGEAIDPSVLASQYSHLPSYVEQQAAEDERAKNLQSQYKDAATYNLNILKELKPESSVYKEFNKTSGSKSPSSIGEIDSRDLASTFEGSNWLTFIPGVDSEQQKVQGLVEHLKTTFDAANRKAGKTVISGAQAKAGINAALSKLATGSDLDHIVNNTDAAVEAAMLGISDYNSNPDKGYVKYSKAFSDYTDKVNQQSNQFKIVTPTNIREAKRKEAQTKINALLGIGQPQPQLQQTANSTLTPPVGSISPKTGGVTGTTTNTTANTAGNNPVGAGDLGANQNAGNAPAQKEEVPALDVSGKEVLNPKERQEAFRGREQLRSDIINLQANQRMAQEALLDPNSGVDRADAEKIVAEAGEKINSTQKRLTVLDNKAQYQQEKSVLDVYNKNGGDVKADSLFVRPYTSDGKNKSWDETVKEINSRRIVNSTGEALTEAEIEGARGNPLEQERLITKANNLVASNLLAEVALAQASDNIKTSYNTVAGGISSRLSGFSGVDPTSEDYKKRRSNKEAGDQAAIDREKALAVVADMARRQLGAGSEGGFSSSGTDGLGNLYDAAGGFVGNSDATGTLRDMAAALPAARLGSLISNGSGRILGSVLPKLKTAPRLPPRQSPPQPKNFEPREFIRRRNMERAKDARLAAKAAADAKKKSVPDILLRPDPIKVNTSALRQLDLF